MGLPRQLVPQKVKLTKKWLKANLDAIAMECGTYSQERGKDVMCFKMFNDELTNEDFSYLTQVLDAEKGSSYVYPAQLRHVGIVRPRLNKLISQQTFRPMLYKTIGVDDNTVKRKFEQRINDYLEEVSSYVDAVYSEVEEKLRQVQMQKYQLKQMLQQQPENAESAQQLEQLKKAEPQINMQLNTISRQLQRKLVLTEDKIDEINQRHLYTIQEESEQLAQESLLYLIEQLDIKEKAVEAFTEKTITGKPYFYVDYQDGDILPTFEKLDGLKVHYPRGGSHKWIQDGDWVTIEEYMSANQILANWGDQLSDGEKEQIDGQRSAYTDTRMNSYPGGAAVFDEFAYNTEATRNNIRVLKIWWKSPRKINFSQLPNKHRPGKVFTHVILDKDLDTPLRKGENRFNRVVYDLFQGVVIDGNIYTNFGLAHTQLRSNNNYSQIKLPVVGINYNNLTRAPYSFIWATKDIQILYDLINYHKELLLALSGVKGFLMDRSQKPEGMSDAEWHYQRKLGTIWIETWRKNSRMPQNFNQFQQFDDTLSQSIQLLDLMQDGLIEQVRQITGVTREAEGVTVPQDQVGTYKESIQNSNLITELIFFEFDSILGKALEQMVNIDIKLVTNKGVTRSYFDQDQANKVFRIPPNMLSGLDAAVKVISSGEEKKGLEELKQLAISEYTRGAIPFSNFISLYTTKVLKDLEKKYEIYAKKAQKLAQENQGAQVEAQKQIDQEKIQLEGQIKMELEKQRSAVEQQKLQLEAAKLEFEKIKHQQEMMFKFKEHEDNKNIDVLKASSENDVEQAYLQEQHRASIVDEMLRAFEITISNALQNKQLDLGHDEALKKIHVDKAKAKKSGKEHISDK